MKITVESSKLIAGGTAPQIVHDEEGLVHLFYVPNGERRIQHLTSEVPLGNWDSLNFTTPTDIAPDDNVEHFNVEYLPDGKMWFVWKNSDTHRFAVWRDEGPTHELTSPYRLYYAVDTEKLYMNISETWQFIGSPNIKQLEGYGDLIEYIDSGSISDITELRSSLDTVKTDVEALKAAPPSSYDDTTLKDRITALEQGVDSAIDMTAVYRVLAVTTGLTSTDSTNFIEGLKKTGHIVTAIQTADLLTVDTTNIDLIALRYYDGSPAVTTKLKELHNSGISIVIGFQGDSLVTSSIDLLTELGIGSYANSNSGSKASYMSTKTHPITQGYALGVGINFSSSPDWHCYAKAPFVGKALTYLDNDLIYPNTILIDAGTTSLKGTVFPYSIAYCSLLYARGGLNGYAVDHIDKLMRWLVQSNRAIKGGGL